LSKSNSTSAAKVIFSATGFGFSAGFGGAGGGAGLGSGFGAGAGAGNGLGRGLGLRWFGGGAACCEGDCDEHCE
jgi:hypothetical protein